MILNFKPQFVDKILSGQKIHTLRRGERWKVGQEIHFYAGIRTKAARQFAKGKVINVLGEIEFERPRGLGITFSAAGDYLHMIGESSYALLSLGGNGVWDKIAKNDGFENWPEMKEFFMKNGKEGPYQIIFWKILKTLEGGK